MTRLNWSSTNSLRAVMAPSSVQDGYHTITFLTSRRRRERVMLAGPPAIYRRPIRFDSLTDAMREAEQREAEWAGRAR